MALAEAQALHSIAAIHLSSVLNCWYGGLWCVVVYGSLRLERHALVLSLPVGVWKERDLVTN